MRLLVVRPLGGLNDSLCQIEHAREIAFRTGRALVIQTELAYPDRSHSFAQPFSSLFHFEDNTQTIDTSSFHEQLKILKTVYPTVYQSPQKLSTNTISDLTFGEKLVFRLPMNCQEDADILVHESAGGGPLGALLLGRVEISPHILSRITAPTIQALKTSCGIHFRNSDYKSDYSALFSFIERLNETTPAVIASDDQNAISELGKVFPNRSFMTAGQFVDRYEELTSTEKALAELIALSMCKNLALVPLSKENWRSSPRYSGFGRLAKQLWAVRKLRVDGPLAFLSAVSSFVGLGRRRSLRGNTLTSLIGGANIRSVLKQVVNPTGVYRQLVDSTK